MKDGYERARESLAEAIASRAQVRDRLVLDAVKSVPRHLFVPNSLAKRAYDDDALPIGAGQTISKPSIQAKMIELAKIDRSKKVLEIGTGSGYQAALLSVLAKYVYTLERIDTLARKASRKLKELGYLNVSVKTFDGTYGWPARGPFDSIIVSAAAPEIPEKLANQLKTGGVMVCPVGDDKEQVLYTIRKSGNGLTVTEIGSCRFVPLIGKHGWKK
jgi:protein-L-isoaspartate(D-aspartate) O-methyltransferase